MSSCAKLHNKGGCKMSKIDIKGMGEEKTQDRGDKDKIHKTNEKVSKYKESIKESVFLIFLSLIVGTIFFIIPMVRHIGAFFLFIVIPILLISIPYYIIQILRLKINPERTQEDENSSLPKPTKDSGFCPHCLARIVAGDVFCAECGKPVQFLLSPPSTAPHYCPFCGFEIQADSVFCSKCGKKIVQYRKPFLISHKRGLIEDESYASKAQEKNSTIVSKAKTER